MSTLDPSPSSTVYNQAVTTLRAILQEQDSTLDISNGGPVDSLLVDGNASIQASLTAQADDAFLRYNLKAIADGTVTVTDTQMDQLAEAYFVTRIPAVPAYGEIEFVVKDDIARTFTPADNFVANGLTFNPTGTFYIYPKTTAGITESFYTRFSFLNYDAQTGYSVRFRIQVKAAVAGASGVLISGQTIAPANQFPGFGRAFAAQNFLGGTSLETNQQMAQRILSGLIAATVGGPENIQAIVAKVITYGKSNSIGVNNVLVTRDRNNLLGIPTGGKVDVYVKAGAISTFDKAMTATVVNAGTRTAMIVLPLADAIGVYRVTVVPYQPTAIPTTLTGSITVTSVDHQAATRSDFNPEMPAQYDRAFSANQQIIVTFTDTRKNGVPYYVTMGAPGSTIADTYALQITYQPNVSYAADALYDPQARPPGIDVLVKAAVPCDTTLSVVATKPSTYNGPSATELAQTLSVLINGLDVGISQLDAYTISALLKIASPQLTLTSVSMTGTVYGQDDVNYPVVQVGQTLTVPLNAAAKIGPLNSYFSTNAAQVTVTLV